MYYRGHGVENSESLYLQRHQPVEKGRGDVARNSGQRGGCLPQQHSPWEMSCDLPVYSDKVIGLLCLLFGHKLLVVWFFLHTCYRQRKQIQVFKCLLKIMQGVMEPLLRSPGSQSCSWAFGHSWNKWGEKKGCYDVFLRFVSWVAFNWMETILQI